MRFPRLLWPLASLVGFLSLGAAEPHPSLPPPVIPDCLGVNIRFIDPKPGEVEMLAEAGFKWVRTELNWAGTERKKGEYDFSAYDRLVAKLAQSKLRAVFTLGSGNPLYGGPGEQPPFTSSAGTPEFREAFARWAVAAVSHFKGRGYLWELWNEPNRDYAWKSPADTPQYVALARATGEALQAAQLIGPKGEAFIGPATLGIDLPFLETCFRGGMLEFWDGVSVHPRDQQMPETVGEAYRQVRLLIRKYAPQDKAIPVIASGWGYSSSSPSLGKDEFARREQQARYLARGFLTDLANDVALSIWTDWQDNPTRGSEAERGYGLVGSEHHPQRSSRYDGKPAYAAAKTLTEQFEGFRYNKRLHSWNSEEDYMLLFEKAEEVRVAVWTVRDQPQRIGIPASPGDLTTVASDGRMLLGARDWESRDDFGIKFAPSADPLYLRFAPPNALLRTAASLPRLPLEYVFSRPGQATPLRLGLKNHARQAVTIRLTSNNERGHEKWAILDGKQDTLTVLSDAYSEKIIAAESDRRDPQPVGLMLGVEIFPPGDPASMEVIAITQRVELVPTNPLIATRMPGQADEIVVKIENPTGESWQGTAFAVGGYGGWKGGGGAISEKIDLVLPQDAPVVLARFPMNNTERQTWWQGIRALALLAPSGLRSEIEISDSRFFELDLPNVQVVADGDPKVKLQVSHDAAEPAVGPLLGNPTALRVQYEFTAGWKCWRVINPSWPPPSEKNLIGRPKRFGAWVHGDAQGCVAHMRFVDASGQFFQTPGVKVDWTGWRQVIFPMEHQADKKLEYWSGANDGEIHYPIDLDSVLVLDNEARQPVKGVIHVCGLSLIY